MIEYQREEQIEILQSRGFLVKVIGVGGAGSNVLDQIALDGMEDAELICMNTDIRTLKASTAHAKVQIGQQLTRGLGAGGDPELGILASEEAESEIRAAVRNQNIVFICAGLGGGTGSGAAPTISRIAKEEGAFVVVFATMPFSFEGRRRIQQAETALKLLERSADALVTFENDRMGELVLPKQGIQHAFANADKIISQSVRAITNVVTQPGLIQIGMDDLLTALKNPVSRCLFGFGAATGKNRAQEALKKALRSPLLDRGQLLEHSRNVVVHIVGGSSMSLYEVELLMNDMSKHVGSETQILFGAAVDEKLEDSLSVTIISSLTLDRLRDHGNSLANGRSQRREVIELEDEDDDEVENALSIRSEKPVSEEREPAVEKPFLNDVSEETEDEVDEIEAEAPIEDSAEDDDREEEAERVRKAEAESAQKREAEAREKEELRVAEQEEAKRSKEREEAEARKEAAQLKQREEEQRRASQENEQRRAAQENEQRRASQENEQRRAAQENEQRRREIQEAKERDEEELRRMEKEEALRQAAFQKKREELRRGDSSRAESSTHSVKNEKAKGDDEGDDLVNQRRKIQEELERKRAELEKLLQLQEARRAQTKKATPERPERVIVDEGNRVADDASEETQRIDTSSPRSTPAVKNAATPESPNTVVKGARGTQQQELQLDPLKGRFEKAAPTVVDGENLDVPTYFRKRGKKG